MTDSPATRQTLEHTGADGRVREYLTAIPSTVRGVVIAFHPYGFDPEAVLDGEGAGDRLERSLPGLSGPASRLGLAVVAPRGRGRVFDQVPLAWHAHLESAWSVASALADESGRVPVATVGLSLGGLEALVLASRHPEEITAAVAVNPIVDLAAWYSDITALPISVLLQLGVPGQIAAEVGATPEQDPQAYRDRSALAGAAALAKVAVQIVWSPADGIVARQREHHSGALAARLRACGAQIDERQLTFAPTGNQEPGRFAHESFDPWSALGFVSEHIDTGKPRGAPATHQPVQPERNDSGVVA